MTPELREWFERGGMESTLQAQELGDLKTLDTFSNKYKGVGIVIIQRFYKDTAMWCPPCGI